MVNFNIQYPWPLTAFCCVSFARGTLFSCYFFFLHVNELWIIAWITTTKIAKKNIKHSPHMVLSSLTPNTFYKCICVSVSVSVWVCSFLLSVYSVVIRVTCLTVIYALTSIRKGLRSYMACGNHKQSGQMDIKKWVLYFLDYENIC